MPRSGRGRSDAPRPAQLEYLGAAATVVASAHAPYLGLTGRVVDETRNLLVLETPRGEVKVPKEGQTFALEIDGRTVEVAGSDIRHRPEDRISKSRSKKR